MYMHMWLPTTTNVDFVAVGCIVTSSKEYNKQELPQEPPTHLKSNLHGAPAADDEMLSFYEKELLESDQFKHQVEQMGENKWILRFKEVKGSLKKVRRSATFMNSFLSCFTKLHTDKSLQTCYFVHGKEF